MLVKQDRTEGDNYVKVKETTSAVVPEAWVRMILVNPLSFSVISTDPGIPAFA